MNNTTTIATPTRLQQLIAAAEVRLLKKSEQSEMVLLFWQKKGGTKESLRKKVNAAYAVAKKYDAFGGADLLNRMDDAFNELGSSEFGVLYGACR